MTDHIIDQMDLTDAQRFYLKGLQKDSDFLECLECCGVDNWNGYGDAQEMMEEYDAET